MANFSASWHGLTELKSQIDEKVAAAEKASLEIIAKGSAIMVREAQANFEGSHKKGLPHVGGSKPNIVSGDLRRSIRSEPIQRMGYADYRTSVSPHMIYGRRVELGYNGSRGYPYFMPAATKFKPMFAALAAETYNKYMK